MRSYREFLTRQVNKYGARFSTASLAPQFIPYYESGVRIKVRTTYPSGEEFVRTGTVGVTTGWEPVFLLMHRSNASGSWDTLGSGDEIIAVQQGRKYVELVRNPA